jgi:HSP20 family molecular chaperone IbpA
MKKIKVQVVESISDGIEQLQMKIRERAYSKFLGRGGGSDRELEDWFTAERELLCILTPTVTAQDQQIIAQVEIPETDPKDIQVQLTSQDGLIHATTGERRPFGVIRFPTSIDPARARAEYGSGVLRLTVPTTEGRKTLKRTA